MSASKIVTGFLSIALLAFSPGFAQDDTYQVAYDQGYRDGVAAGKSDREEKRAFDFANESEFQDASNGYVSHTHDESVYTVAYRRGFEDGYEVGYGFSPPGVKTETETIPSQPETVRTLSGTETIPSGSEIKIRLLDTLSTQRNERGDKFKAEVMEPVRQGNQIIISEGSRVYGTITHLKQAGRIRGRSEMNLVFDELEVSPGNRASITSVLVGIEERAEKDVDEEGTIEGSDSTGRDLGTVGGGAGIGALIGILTGGGSGAKKGAAIGAVAGLAGVLTTRGADIILPSETEMTLRLEKDLVLTTGILRAEP